jgi:hypothetical protein
MAITLADHLVCPLQKGQVPMERKQKQPTNQPTPPEIRAAVHAEKTKGTKIAAIARKFGLSRMPLS